jgi:hypothetical protein
MASANSGSSALMYLCQYASGRNWHPGSSGVDSGSSDKIGMPCSRTAVDARDAGDNQERLNRDEPEGLPAG